MEPTIDQVSRALGGDRKAFEVLIRAHARVVVSGTSATVEDLGSKNGTYLNGERLLSPAILANGDEIWIGRSVARFRFLLEGEATVTEKPVK